jgi:hypothetical protein
VVELGTSEVLDCLSSDSEKVTLHHVEIPLEQRDMVYHYHVRSGVDSSAIATFKSYPSKDLRIAIVGDWGFASGKHVSAIIRDDVHLLVTVGDNVPSLHEKGKIRHQGLQCSDRRASRNLPQYAFHAHTRQSRPQDHLPRSQAANACRL